MLKYILFIVISGTLLCAILWNNFTPKPNEARINGLIEDLSSNTIDIWYNAEKELINMGEPARDVLIKHLEQNDKAYDKIERILKAIGNKEFINDNQHSPWIPILFLAIVILIVLLIVNRLKSSKYWQVNSMKIIRGRLFIAFISSMVLENLVILICLGTDGYVGKEGITFEKLHLSRYILTNGHWSYTPIDYLLLGIIFNVLILTLILFGLLTLINRIRNIKEHGELPR